MIRLGCPSCVAEGAAWTVGGDAETWTSPRGLPVPVVAGECRRCGSQVMFVPSKRAVTEIGARQGLDRSRTAELARSVTARPGG